MLQLALGAYLVEYISLQNPLIFVKYVEIEYVEIEFQRYLKVLMGKLILAYFKIYRYDLSNTHDTACIVNFVVVNGDSHCHLTVSQKIS